MKLKDLYFYCRAHHRQLWSTIARMDDGEIINAGFDVDTIKEFIIGSMDDVDMIVTGGCFACAYSDMAAVAEYENENLLDSNCLICPIAQNVGRCSDPGHGNVWVAFIQMFYNYNDRIINLDNVAIYCDHFRDLALRMANSW